MNNLSDALKELDYIRATAKARDFTNFNDDAGCFGRYVHMQADSYSRIGFVTTASEMRQTLRLMKGVR